MLRSANGPAGYAVHGGSWKMRVLRAAPAMPNSSLCRAASRSMAWLAVGLRGLALVACTSSRGSTRGPQVAGPPPPTVVVTETIQRTVPIYEEVVAQTIALQTVALRAQIAGTLEQVLFKEGTEVKRGQM